MSIQNVAERATRAASSVSNIENGLVRIRPRDLPLLLDSYEVQDVEERRALTLLAAQIHEKNWTQAYEGRVSPFALDLAGIEADAEQIREYDHDVFPGLLQRAGYAKRLINMKGNRTPREVATLLAFRMQRHVAVERLRASGYKVLVAEAALRQQVGGAAVMRDQLEHVAGLVERELVDLRVVPFSAGAHPGLLAAFSIYVLPRPSDMTIVQVGQYHQSAFLETEADVSIYLDAFERIEAVSLGREHSLDMVKGIASSYERHI